LSAFLWPSGAKIEKTPEGLHMTETSTTGLSDAVVRIQDLKNQVREFCDARDWDQFHGAKDLSIGLITEAAELLEEFRFKSESEINTALKDADRRQQIGDELADCLFFVVRFAQRFDFDLAASFTAKMRRNGAKYPVDKARGKNLKYTEL
jgi:NTP pyrophosphatase (non-canonical NTP hydrolase)